MRYFTLIDFKVMVLVFFLGISAFILLYVAWAEYSRKSQGDDQDDGAEHPLNTGHNPASAVLIIVYIAVIIWVLVYVITNGILGGPIA